MLWYECPNSIIEVNNLKTRELSYAGHIMRNISGHYDTLLRAIEGRLHGKRGRGRPIRTWFDDIIYWSGSKQYESSRKYRLIWDICNPDQWTHIEWMNCWDRIAGAYYTLDTIVHTCYKTRCWYFNRCAYMSSSNWLKARVSSKHHSPGIYIYIMRRP